MTEIPPGESWGFYQFIAHSEVEGCGAPFPTPGFYRLDVQVATLLEDNRMVDILLTDPVGIEVIELDLSEFAKCGGGPTCMTLPLIRD